MSKIKLNSAHFLMGSRFDNWIHLLAQNKFKIRPSSIPQALMITFTSLVMWPFALVEALVFAGPIKKTQIRKDPVYIMGHWRTGTTFLQYLMSRDTQFGWLDPVSTATFSNCMFLRPLLTRAQSKILGGARPMDNVKYSVDFPMEDAFAHATISDLAIIHMMPFPQNYQSYIPTAFVADLPERERRRWHREYRYILKKITYIKKGKQLLLKSPDNTARLRDIKADYPDAKFINLCRDPYVTAMSTIHMFKKQIDILALQENPGSDFEDLLEDVILGLMERMYSELFAYEKELDEHDYVEIIYEDFVKDPLDNLRKIYNQLELDGFDEALPKMDAYARSQEGYVKNKFVLSERLGKKINSRLGFYFEHCGYDMREV